MNSKTPLQDENFFRKLFESFQNSILLAVDRKNDAVLEKIDKKNYDLRSDIAQMKDEIEKSIRKAFTSQSDFFAIAPCY